MEWLVSMTTVVGKHLSESSHSFDSHIDLEVSRAFLFVMSTTVAEAILAAAVTAEKVLSMASSAAGFDAHCKMD